MYFTPDNDNFSCGSFNLLITHQQRLLSNRQQRLCGVGIKWQILPEWIAGCPKIRLSKQILYVMVQYMTVPDIREVQSRLSMVAIATLAEV